MSNFIDDFLATHAETVEFNSQQLQDYWDQLLNQSTDPAALAARQILTAEFSALAVNHVLTDELAMKTKGWKITLFKPVLKNLLVTSSIGGILYYLGYTELPSVILPTIIPMLFDIERVELSKKEETIWLRLPIAASKKKLKTGQEWYESLPKDIRQQLNLLDFTDFLDKLNLAGYAEEQKGRYRILEKGKNTFRISIE